MLNNFNQYSKQESMLYNNILLLSRNKLFYTKFNLSDTFQNRIHLIFLHISFLFIKIKQNMENKKYKDFYQKIFDLTFNKIELNMREIGHGDVLINKNMKFLVKTFYNILLHCEKFNNLDFKSKNTFFTKLLEYNDTKKATNNRLLIKYFEKFQTFCFDLNPDSILRGGLDFNYK